VWAYVEGEQRKMNQYKYAPKMKTVTGELGEELRELERYFNSIQSESFQEWDCLRAASDRLIESLLRRIQDKLVKALCDKMVRQMRPVVSDDLHSRLMFDFPDCCHSLNKLRVIHPSFTGESFHFTINFDRFDEHKYSRRPEPGFGLCRTTMVDG
jgi:hypothetical protein